MIAVPTLNPARWRSHSINPKRRADLQGMPAHSLGVHSAINRKDLLQHVSGHPVRHQGRKMRLKLAEFRRRPAMRWPTNASLDRATPSTAKTGKTHRDLAEMRRDGVVPIILQATNATTASALGRLNRGTGERAGAAIAQPHAEGQRQGLQRGLRM